MNRRTQIASPPDEAYLPVWLRTGLLICIAISILAVIRRVVALALRARSGPPQMLDLDRVFASHATLTLAHILPAVAFVVVVPFAVLRRSSGPWARRVLFPLGTIVGVTAYAMSVYPIGGWTERSAVLFYNTIFLFSIARAWLYRTQGESIQERRWLIRSIAILLGIATTRPVMGLFFATESVTHLRPQQFFGIAFWIGFSINWLAVEIWLRVEPDRGTEVPWSSDCCESASGNNSTIRSRKMDSERPRTRDDSSISRNHVQPAPTTYGRKNRTGV